MPAPFAELEFERVKSLIALNVNAAAEMSHWAIPKMLARRGGLILNVSSGSAIVPAPLLALYSGTKAFLDTFSVALAHEYVPSLDVVIVANPDRSDISARAFTLK